MRGARVLDFGMGHAANQRILIRDARGLWQQFTDLDPWHAGVDRLVGAADFLTGFGLQIPHVLVWHTTPHEEQDDRQVVVAVGGPGGLGLQ